MNQPTNVEDSRVDSPHGKNIPGQVSSPTLQKMLRKNAQTSTHLSKWWDLRSVPMDHPHPDILDKPPRSPYGEAQREDNKVPALPEISLWALMSKYGKLMC